MAALAIDPARVYGVQIQARRRFFEWVPMDTLAALKPIAADMAWYTGAAMTALPADMPAQLGWLATGRTMVSGFDGQPRIVPTYTVQISVADHTAVIRAVGLGAAALLGRDVLNALVITLRGPDGVIAVDVPRPKRIGRAAADRRGQPQSLSLIGFD